MSNGVKAWSYSRYADYKQCPYKFKCKHILRLPDPGSPAMARGNTIHKEAEDYVAGRLKKQPGSLKEFKDQFEELRQLYKEGVASVELQWGFSHDWEPAQKGHGDPFGWFGYNTWLRIKADVSINYGDGEAEIIDHKTGKKYTTNEEQVELFSTGPFMRDPKVMKITTRLWYLDVPGLEGEVTREYTRKDFLAIKRDWNRKIVPMFEDSRFAPKPNDRCKWCPYSAAEGGPCKF